MLETKSLDQRLFWVTVSGLYAFSYSSLEPLFFSEYGIFWNVIGSQNLIYSFENTTSLQYKYIC